MNAPSLPADRQVRRSFPARTTLTRGDRLVLRSIAEAMFAQDGEVDAAAIDAHLDEVDAFISAASKMLRLGLRVALFIVRVAPLLLLFRLRTIERLSIDERVAILSRLERSSIAHLSLAFIGWRTVMTMVFYERPAELRSLGYASERHVYKRRLALVVPIASAPAPAPVPIPVPVPDESGVRLRDPDAADSEPLPAATPRGSREVA